MSPKTFGVAEDFDRGSEFGAATADMWPLIGRQDEIGNEDRSSRLDQFACSGVPRHSQEIVPKLRSDYSKHSQVARRSQTSPNIVQQAPQEQSLSHVREMSTQALRLSKGDIGSFQRSRSY